MPFAPQFLLGLLVLGLISHSFAEVIPATGWEQELAAMPLLSRTLKFDHLQAVPVLVKALRKNETVKAIIFMPGATDELYFFNRGKTSFRGPAPTLLDGLRALTNSTAVRVRFRQPFILIYTPGDLHETTIDVQSPSLVETLKAKPYPGKFNFLDRSWDSLAPALRTAFDFDIEPKPKSLEGMHMYRSYMAGFGLSQWEALEALGFSTRSIIHVYADKIEFQNQESSKPQKAGPEQKQPL